MPSFTEQRSLAKTLNAVAKYEDGRGDQVAALERLADAWALSNTIDQQPTLFAHVVAIASRGAVVRTIESIVLTPGDINDSGAALGDRDAPLGGSIRQLIESLFNEGTAKLSLIRALQNERMWQVDCTRSFLDGNLSLGLFSGLGTVGSRISEVVFRNVFAPAVNTDGAFMVETMGRFIGAARTGDWSAVSAALPGDLERKDASGRMLHPVSLTMFVSFDRAILLHFRGLAESRMAGIALAMRLYELDHGRRPEMLTHLVPDYLDAIPADPFAEDDRPLSYAPDAAPPVLYSIGGDGVDDGGTYKLRMDGSVDYEVLDIPFFLNGDRPGRTP